MKKLLLIFALFTFCLGVQAQTVKEYESMEVTDESTITRLRQDVVFEFQYKHEVKYTSAYDEEKKLWKLRIEEVFPPTPTPNTHAAVYYMKLDEGCNPENNLDKFIINGHKLEFKLIKIEKK